MFAGSRDQRQQAKIDNLTLALESARAVGCQIDDTTLTSVLNEDKDIITQLLVDLLKVGIPLPLAICYGSRSNSVLHY